MHLAILWICSALALLVFAVMIYSTATFHGSPDSAAAKPPRGKLLEVTWALIPIVICIVAALPAVRLVEDLEVRVAGSLSPLDFPQSQRPVVGLRPLEGRLAAAQHER